MATTTYYRHVSEMPMTERPMAVNLSAEEREEMRLDEQNGRYPPGTTQDYEERLAKAVFGHDHKKDSKGRPIEQGIGSPGHETLNHFNALKIAEDQGLEAKGTWANSVREFWRRDPERAEKLRLPRPEALAKLNPL